VKSEEKSHLGDLGVDGRITLSVCEEVVGIFAVFESFYIYLRKLGTGCSYTGTSL
jgi:hypothetical protein